MTRRGSIEARVSDNRYFYIMGEGWYVLAREGVNGPYPDKQQAIDFVQTILTLSQSFDFPHTSIDIPYSTQHR